MMFKKIYSIVCMILFALALPVHSQTVNENLKILEPLIGKKWVGNMKSPDGKSTFKTYQEYNLAGDGIYVKFTGSIPDLNDNTEGYFFWDASEKKIAVFSINKKGVFCRGFVSMEESLITVKGSINFPERKFDYRNRFELTADGKMIDRWFQNAFGSWRPGHVVEFTTEKIIKD